MVSVGGGRDLVVVSIFLGQKLFFYPNFFTFFNVNIFWTKNFLDHNFFSYNFFFVPHSLYPTFFVEKIVDPNFFCIKNLFGSTIFLDPKFFSIRILWSRVFLIHYLKTATITTFMDFEIIEVNLVSMF